MSAVRAGPPPSTRDRLVAAAAGVFAERGYDRAGVHDIARRAGLTTGAIYNNFRGKAELLLEVIATFLESQDAQLVAAHRAGDPSDLPRLVRAEARRWTDRRRAPMRTLMLEAHVAARRDPAVKELLAELETTRLRRVAAAIRAAQAAGAVDPAADARALATLLVAVPYGMALMQATELGFPGPGPWGDTVDRMLAGFEARREGRRATPPGRP